VPDTVAVTKIISGRRAALALCAGVAAGAVAAAAGGAALVPIVGWAVAATTILLWTWRLIWPLDAAGTKRLAEGEARVRTTDTAIVSAAVVSLVAVVLALERASQPHTVAATVIVVLSVVSISLSWAVVNTVYALKYARHYYVDQDGGFEFSGAAPAYTDFAYVAFTVGMTFRRRRDTADHLGDPPGRSRPRVAVLHVRDRHSCGRHQPRHEPRSVTRGAGAPRAGGGVGHRGTATSHAGCSIPRATACGAPARSRRRCSAARSGRCVPRGRPSAACGSRPLAVAPSPGLERSLRRARLATPGRRPTELYMAGKKMEGNEEQRRQKARQAKRAGQLPSERGATQGASKERKHLPHDEDHVQKLQSIRQGKQPVIGHDVSTPRPRPRSRP
jgi:uncharacterized membrane protein